MASFKFASLLLLLLAHTPTASAQCSDGTQGSCPATRATGLSLIQTKQRANITVISNSDYDDQDSNEAEAGSFCCFHSADAGNACQTCTSLASRGSWCGGSRGQCRQCSGHAVWCASGVPVGGDWQGSNMQMTHYWDCNGQGCDAGTLQPWDKRRYVSPPGYGPQDPEDFGGAEYGERMWLTGAASDALSALMGDDDGCCGVDRNDGGIGGCGKCLLVQNPDSAHPDWTAVVMKKNRCPPESNGCGAGIPHFDVAAPGFDNLEYSTANICGNHGTGFRSKQQSAAVGSWWSECAHTGECQHLCDELPQAFRKGCRLFASWGWSRGDPSRVSYKAVPCPAAFVAHVASQFTARGPAHRV